MMGCRNLAILSLVFVLASSGCFNGGDDDKSSELNADAGPDHIGFYVEDEEEAISIVFDGSNSTGDIQAYAWDFDRSGPFHTDAEGKDVSFTYTESGKYSVTLKINDEKDEDFDIAEVFINYKKYENSSIEDGESDEYRFPVNLPATRVYGEIRYDPGGLLGNNITLRFTDDEGNSTDREGTEKGEREEGGNVVRWVEIKGEFVLQYKMGTWKAHVRRNDNAGGSEDYSLMIEVDYDPEAGM